MSLNVTQEQARLEELPIRELKQKYESVWQEACRSSNRVWLIKRILWRMQAIEEGDLSERARKRAFEIADDADLRVIPPLREKVNEIAETKVTPPKDDRIPIPGTVLTRTYKGETLSITVRDDGFEYRGERYGSLSAVAKAITGSHLNGFAFFGLKGKS